MDKLGTHSSMLMFFPEENIFSLTLLYKVLKRLTHKQNRENWAHCVLNKYKQLQLFKKKTLKGTQIIVLCVTGKGMIPLDNVQ
jgi:hypothetical protein